MSSTTSNIQSTSPVGADGIVRCYHGEQVDRLVSRTAKNPGREFYACSRSRSERCGFWFWADDPIFTMHTPQSTPQVAAHAPTPSLDPPLSSNGLCTPRPSPLHSTFTPAPQSTPVKRRRPEDFATNPHAAQTSVTPMSKLVSAETPSIKRARLEAIEAGLQARVGDETTSRQPPRPHATVPEQADALPFTHGVETNEATSAPSPASEMSTDVEQDVEPPRVWYSFLGLPPTQESESGTGPSTPKKRPSSVSDGQQDLHGHPSETSSSTLLTPPQSGRPPANRVETFASTASGSGSSRPEPVTPTRYKGKERARSQWDQLIEAVENPFVDTTSSCKSKRETDALQLASRSPRSSLDSQGPPCTPTTAERITSNIMGMRDTIHALLTYADSFDQLDAINYIERLERQKNALEYGEEVKKKRIAELSAERDELKEKVRQSEERVRAKDRIIASLKARR